MSSGSASWRAYCASRARKSRARQPKTPCPPRWRTGSRTRPLYTAHDAAPGSRPARFRALRTRRPRRGEHRRRLGRTAAARGRRRRRGTRGPGERRHLAVAGRRRGRNPRVVARPGSSTASTSTWRPSSWTRGVKSSPPHGSCCGCTRSGVSPQDAARGNLGADPLGHEARTGDEAFDFAPVAALARLCAEEYPGLRALTVDALPYHEAGGSAAQELGCSLATGVAYLRELTEAGLSRRTGRARSWSSGTRPPPTSSSPSPSCGRRAGCGPGSPRSAVRRAGAAPARRDLAGDDDAPRPVGEHAAYDDRHAGRRGRRRRRRHRAALRPRARPAGRVRAPDRPQHLDDPGRGVASVPGDRPGGRLLVRGAAHRRTRPRGLGVLPADRAGGRPGGALRSGRLGQDLARAPGRRAARSSPSGANPSPGSASSRTSPSGRWSASPRPSRRPAACPACGATRRTRPCAPAPTPTSRRPAPGRGSSWPPSAPPPPTPPASPSPSNLFQAGGIEPVTEGTFEDSGATEVCLCSSDALYEEQAAEVPPRALRAAGAGQVFLAGRPGQYPDVDAYVFAGCDAVAVLSATLDRMGVS